MKIIFSLIFAFLLLNIANALAFARKPKTEAVSVSSGTKYMCPMRCYISDKPGKCAQCGMELWEASE